MLGQTCRIGLDVDIVLGVTSEMLEECCTRVEWHVMLSQLPQGEASRRWRRERESDVLAMDLQQLDDQCFAGLESQRNLLGPQ